MADTLPRHIGDVKETVEAAEVHEHAVFGDVLGLTGNDLTFGEGLEEILTLGVAFFFKQHTAGHDDVAATAVDLQHAEFVFLVTRASMSGTGRRSTWEPGRNASTPPRSTV